MHRFRASLNFRMGNVEIQRFYEYFRDHQQEWPAKADVPTSFVDFERNWTENGFFYLPHGAGQTMTLIQEAIECGEYARERGICSGLD